MKRLISESIPAIFKKMMVVFTRNRNVEQENPVVESWIWVGMQWMSFRFGKGSEPIQRLLSLREEKMKWSKENGWEELSSPPLFLTRFIHNEDDNSVVYNVMRDRTTKRYFLWGFPDGNYKDGGDGHPHPNASHHWLNRDGFDVLLREMETGQ